MKKTFKIPIIFLLLASCFTKKHNLKTEKIEIIEYLATWPVLYEEYANKIKIALEENFIEIHHFGSTSVPGLAAKPKIDILAVVKDINKINNNNIETLGFENRGEVIKTGRYFAKESPRIHLHIFQKGNPIIAKNLKFRDCLRSNEKIRKEYEKLKRDLAAKHTNGMEYMKDKTNFIENVIC